VLFENTLDSVAIADMDGRVLEANPAYLRMYGYTADEVKGMNLADVVAPEDRGAAVKAMASLASGRAVARTFRVRRKDGARFMADLAASVMAIGGERRIMSVTRDVTERFRAEQTLNQSERMYRAVFESANDAVFIESVDGRILDVNRNGCELLGYGKDELLRRSVSYLVPPEARAWLPHVTDAILRDGTFRTEAVRLHKDGRHVPVDISASTMELDGRTVVLSIVRDITERRRAEQALRESEEKFLSVSEQSPNMIFINSRGRVAYANQKSAEVMGYTREGFYSPGFDFMQLIAPESAEQIKAAYARHARGEEVEPYEYTLVTKDGRRVESLITTRLIDYEGSKAILGIVTDITERKAGERALRESEESFRALAENASDGVTIGDEHGRHAFANRRAAEMLGYSVEQLLEMTFREFLPPGDRQMIEERFARRLRGEDVPSHHEMAVTRRDGSVAPVEVGVSQTRWHGRPAVMVVLRDVAERKRAEQALAASEERYRNLVESSPDGIAVYQDGVVVLANRASAVLLGYSDGAELVGRTAARPRALSRPKTGRGSRNAPSCSAPAARPPALCW